MMTRKGILLAGGRGTRLYPATAGVNKHLLPVWDRPLIYYPLVTLMQCGVREILVVANERDLPALQALLGHGARWGLRFSYETQAEALGIGHALGLAEDWLDGAPCVLGLGDNVFTGPDLSGLLRKASALEEGATVFATRVDQPQDYGVVRLDTQGRPIALIEKPARPVSPWAVTGLYFYDARACMLTRELTPSARGELEITDLNQIYLDEHALRVVPLRPEVRWWDCGTFTSLARAAQHFQETEQEEGRKAAGPEETALRLGLIDVEGFRELIARMPEGRYRRHLELLPTATVHGAGA